MNLIKKHPLLNKYERPEIFVRRDIRSWQSIEAMIYQQNDTRPMQINRYSWKHDDKLICVRVHLKTLLLSHILHRPHCFCESHTCSTTLTNYDMQWKTKYRKNHNICNNTKCRHDASRQPKEHHFRDQHHDILDETDDHGKMHEILYVNNPNLIRRHPVWKNLKE